DPQTMMRKEGTSRLPGGTSGAQRNSQLDDAAATENTTSEVARTREPSQADHAQPRDRGPFRQNEPTERKPIVVTERALAIHRDSPVFDGHNDLPWQVRNHAGSSF